MDRERFLWAVQTAKSGDMGIGTLNESPLHAALKLYYEPRRELHEISVGSYVADIANEVGCVEIQTRSYYKIKKKLSKMLEQGRVTVVYPIAGLKWVRWIDKETGETTERRKSPKRAKPAEAFFELDGIKELVTHPNFRFRLVVLELEEFKYLDGWGESRKNNATRATRVPIDIIDEIRVSIPEDLTLLLPELPRQFTTEDIKKSGGISETGAQRTISVLRAAGLLKQVGKKGRRKLYEII